MGDILDIVAITISVVSIIISLREKYQNGRPFFKVESVRFVPDKFICYSSSESDGYKMLSEENKRIIRDSRHKVLMQNIDGEYYLLFNLLHKDAELDNVKLILAPLVCTYINTGAMINEIRLTKAFTVLKEDSRKSRNYKINGTLTPSRNNKIVLNVAYVCKEGQRTSLLYNKLTEIKKEFDYLYDKEIAKRVITFKREEFRGICYNYRRKKYKVKIIFVMDEYNGLTWEGK